MLLIRAFDSQLPSLYTQGLLRGSSTRGDRTGGESRSARARRLQPDDYITSTHRGHGHVIAKGGDVEADDGRAARSRRRLLPRQGRQHAHRRLLDRDARRQRHRRRRLRARGGAALSRAKSSAAARSALCFFGEGALNQGVVPRGREHGRASGSCRSCSLCENNQFAMSARVAAMTSVRRSVRARSEATGSRRQTVDGMDVACRPRCSRRGGRSAHGPVTGRACSSRRLLPLRGSLLGRPRCATASAEEAAPWRERDPIASSGERLVADGGSRRVADIEASRAPRRPRSSRTRWQFAQASPFPDAAGSVGGRLSVPEGRRAPITYSAALNEALREEMARDPARLRDGRGHRRLGRRRRRLRRHQGPASTSSARAGARHADLGGGDRRARRRCGADRAAARGRAHVLRLRDARDGAARQPGGEDALHVRRPGKRAARRAIEHRRLGRQGRAALAVARDAGSCTSRASRSSCRRRRTTPRAC